MFIPVNGGQGMSRPFVVGLILLLVFLGMQSDLVPSKQPETEVTVEGNKKDSAKERIILELSKSNEKLEKELHQLQQQLLLAKHAAHQHGITHDSHLGAMLYAENLETILDGNITLTNSTTESHGTVRADDLHEAPLLTEDTANPDTTSRHSSRRELPNRTNHQAHQTAEMP